jgi:hypothetical protein
MAKERGEVWLSGSEEGQMKAIWDTVEECDICWSCCSYGMYYYSGTYNTHGSSARVGSVTMSPGPAHKSPHTINTKARDITNICDKC